MSDVLCARDLVVHRRSRRGTFELRVPEFALRAGEALAVIGPNGAGKTTLLRALAGLEPGATGELDGPGPGRRGGVRGAVAMVFQRPIAFSGSVLHNVSVALAHLPRAERRDRARAALSQFGIGALENRAATRLSGGELRRLALARAIALEPSVLLLDEPFDDLDTSAQEALSLDLERAMQRSRLAIALVTHDLRRAVLLADRIALLRAGRIEQVDRVDDVLRRPRDAGLARLVGMSNLVEGSVERRSEGRVEIGVDGEHRVLAVDPEQRFAVGARVLVGLRPEHVKVEVGRGEGEPIGKGVVRHVVSDGALATLRIAWAGAEIRAHLVAGRGLARTLQRGDAVSLAVRREDVHLLPPEDEPAA